MKTKNVKKVLVPMLLVIFAISLAVCSGCFIQELPPETYTLTFSDGIGGDSITMEKEEKTVLSLPENTFTREGWTFVGWQLGEEVYAEGQAYTVTGPADFVAKWQQITYEIIFTTEEGSGEAPIIEAQPEGAEITLPANTFVNEGYDFIGWQLGETVYAAGDIFTVGAQKTVFVAKWRLSAPEIGQPEFSQFDYDYDRVGGKDMELPLDLKGATLHFVEVDGELIDDSAFTYDYETGCLVIFEAIAIQLDNGLHTVKIITDAANAKPAICQVFVDNSIKTTFDEITTKSFVYGKDDGVTFAVGYNGSSVKSIKQGDITLSPEFYEIGESSITIKSEWLRRSSDLGEYTLSLTNFDSYTFTITTNVIFYTDYDLVTIHDETVSSAGQNSLYQDSTRVEIVDGPDAMDGKVLQITPHTVGGHEVYHGYYTLRSPSLPSTWKDVGFEGNYFLVEFDYLTEGTSVGTFGYQSVTTSWRKDLLHGSSNDGVVHHFKAIVSKEEVGGGVYLYAFFENGGGKIYVDNFSITELDEVPVLVAPENYEREGDLQLSLQAKGYAYVKTLLDGNEIAATYDPASGAITIEKSLLDQIESGAHTVTVETKLGSISAVVRFQDSGVAVLKDTSVNYAYGVDESVKLFGTFSEGVRLVSLKQLDKVVDSTYAGWDFATCDTESNFASLASLITGENDSGYIQLPSSFLDKFYGSTQFVAEFSNGDQVTFTINSDVVIFSNFDESTVIGDVGSPMHSGLAGSVEIKEVNGSKAWILSSMTGYPTAFTVEFDAQSNAWFGIKADSSKLYRITFTYQITGLAQDSVYFCLAGPNGEIIDNNIFGKYDGIEPWNDVGGYIARYNLIADGEVHTFDTGWFTYNAAVRMTKIQLPAFGAESGSSVIIDDYRITQTTGISNPVASLPEYNVQQTSSYGFECAKPVESLKIDGADFAFTQEDSTVALSIEAMDQLSVGSHNVEVITADGIFRGSILVKFNTVATLNETSKAVTVGGGDVLLDGEFANVSVISATRRGGNQFDNGYNGAVEIGKDHFALGANGLTVSQALVDQVYGTMNYEVTLSDSTVLRFSLVGNSALFTNYDETSIWDGAPNNNGAICQDTGMLSIENVEGDNKLKYTPANATLGHAANGGVHNGAFTFSIVGLHAGWLPITLADGNVTFSFDYSIVLGEKSVSGYSIYYATRSGGEVTELLDATKSNWTKTFASGELACVKIFCPATAACSFESIRTPLVAVVRYYERDEDLATNAWRKWVVDCNYPKDNAESDLPVQPVHNVMVQLDTGKPNSDGSISEDHTTWKRTLDTYYGHGLTADYRWFDAGWYTDPYGQTVVSDWWGTVGTWELDKQKWPGESFKEAVDYAHDNGSKFLLWFEAERVTHLDGLADNFGYDREWALSDHGDNNAYLNNLGNEDCLNWVYNRIISMMEKYGVDLYREDMNMDCLLLWQIGDAYQGVNRVGITENLYMQGHYELWDRIIEWCGQNGRSTYVDSCAAGGRRNDLETLRRGVPFNRSDVDRSTVCFRLGITWSLTKWFPFTGAFAKDVPMNDSVFASKTTEGDHDIYALRGTYVPSMTYLGRWYHDEDMIDWDTLKQGLKEWEYISKYFYKEYYTLTPYAYVTDDTVWTSFMYFDKESDSGVIQAFRQPNCADDRVTVKVKGVNPDNYYEVRDLDRVNTIARVKGSQLMEGLTLYAENPRTAIVIYLNPVA